MKMTNSNQKTNTNELISNKIVFSDLDFETWAYGENLSYQEKFLLSTYLDKNLKTVEAGTGGGRIILEMKKLGFTSLHAFDYVPKLIEEAKKKDTAAQISFAVEDATNLKYEDENFDQLVYLMQIICCIENEAGRLKALEEAYRILKKGGTAIFSFLNFDDRLKNPLYMSFIAYIKLLRILRNSPTSIQYIPWLKWKGKPNLGALLDKKPYMYWYKLDAAYQSLKEANFKILAIGSDPQIFKGKMHTSLEDLKKESITGGLYFVCTK